MRNKRKANGFTLIEVMVVGVVLTLVLMASSQATIFFVKQMKKSEKGQEVLAESQDLVMYVRRSSRNLSTERLNMPSSFYLRPIPQRPASMGANPTTPVPAMSIDPAEWLKQGNSNPLYNKAQAAFSSGGTYNILLDSFTLEEHALSNVGGGLDKKTRRLLVSRCDELDNYFTVNDSPHYPGVTALYVLGVMPKRPFISHLANGSAVVNCCPPGNSGCTDGGPQSHFFRTYAITFDDSQNVVNVEEFPKSNADNPVVGTGFGLYFMSVDGANVSIQTFSMVNGCYLRNGTLPQVCVGRPDIKTLMSFYLSVPDLIKIDTKSISTSLSNDMRKTGVISL
ncbi:prepilin-type N-terminal cleavage/methylation domain-containing protein [Bdellovibrio sp. HCB-110]|uniref:prepilin-type N-terminal cleavage/methylation domain-containing protein n=1 Tax=Bdellovibrio sp. HCB-110 TaxID=3391182 RepID=UPI0039B5251C